MNFLTRILLLLPAALPALAAPPVQVRFATFNTSLFRDTAGALYTDLSNPNSTGAAKVKQVAEIIQRTAPDVLLVNEFDWDPQKDTQGRTAVDLFHDHFLAVPQNGQAPLSYPYRYTARPNTGFSPKDVNENGVLDRPDADGVRVDFDNNGILTSVTETGTEEYANDCYGFGRFRGESVCVSS